MMEKYELNLQLFAEPINSTTSSGLSPEMKTYYEERLLDMAGPKLVHDQFGDEYPIPKRGGKTIEFRKYSPLPKATTPLTEGVTPQGSKLTVTTITSTVKQYGDWVPLTDVLELTAIDNNVVQATKLLGDQAGRTLDTVSREILSGGTNVMYAPKVAAGGTITEVTSRASLDATCKMNVDMIFRAARFLKTLNAAPHQNSYVGIIHPDVAYDLMRCEEWIDAHKYATPENIYEGEIGKIGGVRFVETTEAKIWSGDGCPSGLAVYSTLILGAHAYGKTNIEGGGLRHIIKQLGYGDDPLDQRSSCGWKSIKAVERLVEEYMVRIESCSSFSATAMAN